MLTRVICATAVSLFALAPVACAGTVPRQALAYYYPWFTDPKVNHPGDPNWGRKWDTCNEVARVCGGTPEYPSVLGGPYGTDNPATVDAQLAAMQAMGITGVVVSWWGAGSDEDVAMPSILASAAAHNMKVAIAFETLAPGTQPKGNVLYVLTTYAGNKAYLHVQGAAVLFINSVAYHAWPEGNWADARDDVFATTGIASGFAVDFNRVTQQPVEVRDGTALACYDYGTHGAFDRMSLAQIKASAPGLIKSYVNACAPAISVGTAFPQHNDYLVHNNTGYYVQNYNGDTMRTTLAAAIAANPDWLLLVSWNEWGEGSECEASDQFGAACTGSDNAAAIKAFLALPPNNHR